MNHQIRAADCDRRKFSSLQSRHVELWRRSSGGRAARWNRGKHWGLFSAAHLSAVNQSDLLFQFSVKPLHEDDLQVNTSLSIQVKTPCLYSEEWTLFQTDPDSAENLQVYPCERNIKRKCDFQQQLCLPEASSSVLCSPPGCSSNCCKPSERYTPPHTLRIKRSACLFLLKVPCGPSEVSEGSHLFFWKCDNSQSTRSRFSQSHAAEFFESSLYFLRDRIREINSFFKKYPLM